MSGEYEQLLKDLIAALRPPDKIDIDAVMTIEQAAKWLQMDERTLLVNIRRKKIPAMKINERVFRIHPRTVLISKGAIVDPPPNRRLA